MASSPASPGNQMRPGVFTGYHTIQPYRPNSTNASSSVPASPNAQPTTPTGQVYGHMRLPYPYPQRPPFLYTQPFPPLLYQRQDMPFGAAQVVTPSEVSESKPEKLSKFEVSEEDAWTAHKTEDGVIYYYNSVTGVSTYDKPPGFKGEANVNSQPTPVSCEKLDGTDWLLVNTNDGKKYYYNPKTQATSWQVPPEIVEKAKEENINTPAALMGGREAKGTSTATALDTIKKKLHEYSGNTTADSDSVKPVSVTGDSTREKTKENTEASSSESSSDSEDDTPTVSKEELTRQFKEMLKEKGVPPFAKWDKELPKIITDPRFKAITTHTERKSIFEHYVRTRAEEERKEKRAALKAAADSFKQLLDEASSSFTFNTTYEIFASAWRHDPRYKAVDRKEREALLNERILPLKKAEEERVKAIRASLASDFKQLLKENDVTVSTRWSKVKDHIRHDPRYKAVKHENRENIFNEYLAELRAAEQELERAAKAKREEENKLREREREMRKRKEREEEELQRVRAKARRKDAVTAYQALLTEKIKDAEASWTESRPKLEKDPLGRATNPELDMADRERLFRDHVKDLYERCEKEYRALLADVITTEAVSKQAEEGKDILTSWSDAKELLKSDHRFNRMPRRARELWWHRYAQDMQRRLKASKDDSTKAKPRYVD